MTNEIYNIEAAVDKRARGNLAESQEINLNEVEIDNIKREEDVLANELANLER